MEDSVCAAPRVLILVRVQVSFTEPRSICAMIEGILGVFRVLRGFLTYYQSLVALSRLVLSR